MDDVWAAPKQNDEVRKTSAKRGLWPWFIAGFAVVFVGMALVVTMYPILPSGRGVLACPLWRYYLIEARRAMSSLRNVGPGSGSSSAALVTAVQHIVCSSLGGAATWGAAWAIRRLKAREQQVA